MNKNLVVKLGLTAVLLAGFWLRLKDIGTPLADWHSWRQADTAAVAREYVKNGIDLLHPRYQDISSLQSGRDNPEGYRMVEFPAVNGLVAYLYQTLPLKNYPIHVVYRFVNIIFSLLAAVAIYQLVRRVESSFTGLLAAAAFLFLPYSIFYSRTVLPEVAMVSLSMTALWLGVVYTDTKKLLPAAGFVIAAALALLIKPVAIFLLLPLVLYILAKQGIKSLTNYKWWLLAAAVVLPLLLWRQWISRFPEGIPASAWLFNGNGIRFKGAFFYWLFADRLGRIILGYWGTVLVAAGLLAKKKSAIPGGLVAGSLLYLAVFATGNVQHDYYQIPLLPAVSITIAYGLQYLRRLPGNLFARYGLILVITLFTLMFSWYHIRTLYSVNNPAIVAAGQAVDRLTPPKARVIAPYMGDTAFLYQTNRLGWPIGGNIEDKISRGATHYVSTSYDDEARELESKYPVIQQTDQYILIDLTTNQSMN